MTAFGRRQFQTHAAVLKVDVIVALVTIKGWPVMIEIADCCRGSVANCPLSRSQACDLIEKLSCDFLNLSVELSQREATQI